MGGIPTLIEAISKLAVGGAAGVVVAFLLEYITWFQKLSPDAKKWIVLGLQLGLPVVATVALQYVPVNVWALMEPYWQAIALGFVAWLGSQVAHNWDVKKKAESNTLQGRAH